MHRELGGEKCLTYRMYGPVIVATVYDTREGAYA